MIENIIFDMGGVLIRFDPGLFINRYGLQAEDRALLMREVFQTVEWARLDRGSLTDEEAIEAVCKNLPGHLHPIAASLITAWDEPILPMDGMQQLLKELKAAGYGLYLLSNASVRQHQYWDRIPGSELFDGTVISADVHFVKPEPGIYQTLYDTFCLRPDSCFFVDDSPQNVEGALHTGMPGTVFRGGCAQLRETLQKQNILT